MKNEATGVRRLVAATRFSLAGLKATYSTEEAFRQECWLAVCLIPIAVVIGESATDVAMMIASVLLLLITELLNTAVEIVVDRIGEEFHELSGRAKDAGSAAVLIALILMIVIWLSVIIKII
ncbi:MAG: diacylglycerol kinase [Granulosicoccus sp.]|nr:diacylglycerol kinase [Granulosicoccus sp.]